MAEFLEGMRALVRKDVLRAAAQYLQVDISAAGISTGPAATPAKPVRKAERAPAPSRPAAPPRSAPSPKTPTRAAPRKKAAAPRTTGGGARPAVAPPKARAARTPAPAAVAPLKAAEQAAPASPVSLPSGSSGDEIAEALLAHVEIEPGQGIDDLALAMGTPAAELQEPLKKLLAENKITEELRQGQTSYYPA
ncbi:hypothetical protein [Sorangium atrum]|uniref:MarR family transcriptional regulator n=1 Tax=Sorangium atrum TaxID=2995308 RepID=A0ABT5C6C0_9BACT|nr:hypothetical protein [Sorangium aterium]MDC0681977.1 hypothetical protein [Sorangium aterium]